MEKSFLNGIISQALAAQDQQASYDMNDVSEAQFSGITEKDGYVGEMVKQSLAIMEAKTTPADYAKPFSDEYVVIVNSLNVVVAGTQIDSELEESTAINSIQDLLDLISGGTGLSMDNAHIIFADGKVRIDTDSEYGKVEVEANIDAYQIVDPNTALGLPLA